MPTTTRTIGPLHFEDLEPRRFEDLVRQLAYDFRRWRSLEATGRAGSDEGFDVRGWEALAPEDPSQAVGDEAEQAPAEDRLWLIQCKRERTMPPGRLAKHLNAIPPSSTANVWGMVLAAPCDFSKRARDALREWARERGIDEVHVWGRGELEDRLLQPSNDNLLFSYFGISLRVRRRSVITGLRSWLSMKRKTLRVLENSTTLILLRDPRDDRYPYRDPSIPMTDHGWRVVRFYSMHPKGLLLERWRGMAAFDETREHWDWSPVRRWGGVTAWDNPWDDEQATFDEFDNVDEVETFWQALPEHRRANLVSAELLLWSDILEVDEIGDPIGRMPHLFVLDPGRKADGFFLQPLASWAQPLTPEKENRATIFPAPVRRRTSGE